MTATKAPAAKVAPKAETALTLCLCGCGDVANKTYRPGHDARAASQVAKAILAGGNAKALLAQLPTEALKAKARAQVARKTAKAAAAKSAK